jgi:hypothetical protein
VALPATLRPQAVVTADFNRDGVPDLAVACDSPAGLRILYGGATGFAVASIDSDPYLNVLATADLNRDGRPDLVAASTRNSSVTVFLGSATGPKRAAEASTGGSPRGIAVADVNADGAPDVVTANRLASTVSVLLGDPRVPGRLAAALDVPAGLGSRDLALADFDGDGLIDVATGNEYAANVTVLVNRTEFVRAGYVFGRMNLGTPSTVVGGADAVWTADFNRDGKLDVATLADETPWRISVLLTGGPTVSLAGTGYPSGFGVDDVNADGNADVFYTACCPYGATFSVFLGDGRGGFRPPVESASGTSGATFVTADLNNDARPDGLMLGWHRVTGAPFLQALVGRGDGTFTDGLVMPLDAWGRDVRAVDINRDGDLDIAVLLVNRVLQVWYGNGSGGVSAGAVTVAFPMLSDADDVKFGDLNRDGLLDAVVAGGTQAAIALGTGTGFAEPTYLPIERWGWLSLRRRPGRHARYRHGRW